MCADGGECQNNERTNILHLHYQHQPGTRIRGGTTHQLFHNYTERDHSVNKCFVVISSMWSQHKSAWCRWCETKTRQRERGRQRWLGSEERRSWLKCLRCKNISLMRTKNFSSRVWRSWRPPRLQLHRTGTAVRPVNICCTEQILVMLWSSLTSACSDLWDFIMDICKILNSSSPLKLPKWHSKHQPTT